MATIYSNLYTEAAADNDNYSYRGPYGSKAGEVVNVNGTVTISGSLATNDIANLFPIPAGAKIIRYEHYYEDHGSTCTATIQCGTTDMKASIALGTAVAIGSIAELSLAECAAAWAANATAEKNVNIEYTSVSTPTSGAVYTFACQYVMPSV